MGKLRFREKWTGKNKFAERNHLELPMAAVEAVSYALQPLLSA